MQGLHRMLIEHHFMMVFGGTFAEVVRKPATKLQLVCLERSGFMPIAKESCRHLTIADIYGVF